ncbi:MAG: hypothetical protein DM484_24915, partial [Candidatus Methylumidiphilus alinenensis]
PSFMIKNSQNPVLTALLLSLGIFLSNPAFSFEKPEAVRIASIASNQAGKSIISGGQSAVISAKGWLEDDLNKIGVKLEWFPVPTNVGGPLFNEALANRSADFANYGDFPALIAKAGGIVRPQRICRQISRSDANRRQCLCQSGLLAGTRGKPQ